MKTVEIIFSPTGGTGKVASMISACWNKDVTKIDLSDIKIDFTKCITAIFRIIILYGSLF